MIHGGTRRTATATPFVHHGGTRRTATATPFVHEGPRRDTENCNCNTFCPRRATEDHGELQLQHLLSTKGHGGTRRTATATPFVHEGATEDPEGHGERQLQHLLSTKSHGGTGRTATPFVHEGPRRTRRTATATPFVHEGPRRTTENCNCNTFCPRRATEGHGELQLQHLLSTKGHGGTRRTELQHLLSTKGRGGTRRTATATPFVHEGTRRDTENCNCNTFCPRRDAEGRGERRLQHLLSTKGRGGTGRTATATPFVHEGMRGTTKKTFFCPRWAAKNSFLIHEGL